MFLVGVISESCRRKKLISILIDGKMFEIFYEYKKPHEIASILENLRFETTYA